MITMDISHTATTPVLYVSDGTTNLFSSLQQGTNSYTFTATAATMFIGVAETGVPNGVSTFNIDDVELVHLGFSTVTVYQEDFSQRNVKCNGWNVGSPQYNNTDTEITSNGKLHIETTVLYGGSKYDHTLVAGEEYTISMNVTHSSTSAVLYAFDGSLTSTTLQQGYNELTFTAGSSNVTIGVGETVTPSGTSEFFIDNVKLIRLNGASLTESLCYGNGSVGDYRYSFQGMDTDDEVKGEKNSYTTHFRQYDPRVARWLSTDPVTKHDINPYNAFSNSPLVMIDPNGDTDYYNTKGKWIGTDGIDNGDKILVLKKEDARTVKKATRRNNSIALNTLCNRDLIQLVDNSIITRMEAMYKSANEAGIEQGAVIGTSPSGERLVATSEGTESEVDQNPARRSIQNDGGNIKYDIHTHPPEESQPVKDIENDTWFHIDNDFSSPDDQKNRVTYRKVYGGYELPSIVLAFSWTPVTRTEFRNPLGEVIERDPNTTYGSEFKTYEVITGYKPTKSIIFFDSKGDRKKMDFGLYKNLCQKVNSRQSRKEIRKKKRCGNTEN